MRFDNVSGGDVCGFICGGSECSPTCCMNQVLGHCYYIAEAWDEYPERRPELLRVMKWRIDHGERTVKQARAIGVHFGVKVV